jgi:hypothetical protein
VALNGRISCIFIHLVFSRPEVLDRGRLLAMHRAGRMVYGVLYL